MRPIACFTTFVEFIALTKPKPLLALKCLHITPFCQTVLLTAVVLISMNLCFGQTPVKTDSTAGKKLSLSPKEQPVTKVFDSSWKELKVFSAKIFPERDSSSTQNYSDTIIRRLRQAPNRLLSLGKKQTRFWFDSNTVRSFVSPARMVKKKPWLSINSGYAAYNLSYRSNVDTPFAEKNLFQHQLNGSFGMEVKGIPLLVNYWLRRTNSNIFNDISDVQVSFDPAMIRKNAQMQVMQKLIGALNGMRDSLSEKLLALKADRLAQLEAQLKTQFSAQKLMEVNELLNVDGLGYEAGTEDSVNRRREDSARHTARKFLELYQSTKSKYDQLAAEVDSLQQECRSNFEKAKEYYDFVRNPNLNLASRVVWSALRSKYGVHDSIVPSFYRNLLNIRKASIGRSPISYSELTAKNLSVNGVNFEYNSWYYFAVTAGTVNYRFRDFALNKANRSPQYLMMLRAGIGRVDGNNVILSAYRGKKQFFAGSASSGGSIAITGLSAETRWQLNRTTWIKAEIGASTAPDIRNTPSRGTNKFSIRDENNRAMAFQLYSYIPLTQSKIEAQYKSTGANFQSFNSFQTTSALESWSVKAEQMLLRRRIRLSASLKKNEFSNPFLVQNYKSNSIFKSVNASFRFKKLPVLTFGYQPMSQLTVLDNQIIENRFQSLSASLFHNYKIKQLPVAATILVNKYYNSGADTAFIYYNALNIYALQHLYFSAFTANIAVSYTGNPGYTLTVLEGGFEKQLYSSVTAGFGFRVNNLNKRSAKIGAYFNAGFRIFKSDIIHLNYEHGYLPGSSGSLVRNEMANIQFVKSFHFKN
jgi:hypothetical protein